MEKWRGLISALCYRHHQYRPSQVRFTVRAWTYMRSLNSVKRGTPFYCPLAKGDYPCKKK